MKRISIATVLLSFILTLSSCNQETIKPEKQHDLPKEIGISLEDAIVVTADNEIEGVDWEYAWLEENACKNNEGYKNNSGQALKSDNEHNYDLITAICEDGKSIDYYFMIDNFFGKF